MIEELASFFLHFFLCVYTFVKVKAIKLSSSDMASCLEAQGSWEDRVWFQRQDAGEGGGGERKIRSTRVPFPQIKWRGMLGCKMLGNILPMSLQRCACTHCSSVDKMLQTRVKCQHRVKIMEKGVSFKTCFRNEWCYLECLGDDRIGLKVHAAHDCTVLCRLSCNSTHCESVGICWSSF